MNAAVTAVVQYSKDADVTVLHRSLIEPNTHRDTHLLTAETLWHWAKFRRRVFDLTQRYVDVT